MILKKIHGFTIFCCKGTLSKVILGYSKQAWGLNKKAAQLSSFLILANLVVSF
jgi:hypothetical protein